MKKTLKLFAGLLCALMLGLALAGCGGMPTLAVDRTNLTNVLPTAKAQENDIGQITEPGFSGANLPSFTLTITKTTKSYEHLRILLEADASLQIITKDANDIFDNAAITGWGQAEGFALTEPVIVTFYVIATQVGEYPVTIKLVDVANSNLLVTQKIEMIHVTAAA